MASYLIGAVFVLAFVLPVALEMKRRVGIVQRIAIGTSGVGVLLMLAGLWRSIGPLYIGGVIMAVVSGSVTLANVIRTSGRRRTGQAGVRH